MKTAQQRANRAQDEKRKKAPRLPTARLTELEQETMQALYDQFGGAKKKAILESAEYYLKNKE